MRDLIHRTIEGEDYEIEQFASTKSLRILTALIKLIGEPIGLAVGLKDQKLNPDQESKIIGAAVRALCDRLDEDKIIILIKELIDSTRTNGAKINFEIHFQGRIGHLFKLIYA